MWPFSDRKKTPEASWWRRLMAVEDRCDGLERRVDERYAELKAMRGQVHALKKGFKDDPGQTNDERPDIDEGERGAPFIVGRRRHIRGW